MARVLVVEDEDLTRVLLESRLRGAGHRVRGAASVAEAHGVLERAGVPAVLVTDMSMPGGSGLGLVAALREDPACADLPVIFLSGRALPADVEAGRALGATHLAKPFTVAALTGAVDAALQAAPAALEAAVRRRLDDLGAGDDQEERDLFAHLLASFVEQAPAAVAALEQAVTAGDATAVEASAHKLAGAAANLGAAPLARVCADLEDLTRTGGLPEPLVARADLRRELATTCRVLGALARELGGADAETYD